MAHQASHSKFVTIRRKVLPLLVFVYLCSFAYFLAAQIGFALDPTVYYASERNISWVYRHHDPSLLQNDLISDMREQSELRFFYHAQKFLAQYANPFYYNRIYPLVLWLLTAIPLYLAAKQLSGRINAVAATGIYLMSQIIIGRMVGGLAHTFAFPLMCFFLWFLLSGRVYSAAMTVILSAVFYPVVSPLLGLTLTIWILFPGFSKIPKEYQTTNWELLRKVFFLTLTGSTTLALIYLNAQQYIFQETINSLTPVGSNLLESRIKSFGGPVLHNPIVFLYVGYSNQFRGLFGWNFGAIFTFLLAVYLFFGCTFKVFADGRMQKIRPFIVGTILCLAVIRFVDQGSIYRYIGYPLMLYFVFILPVLFRKTSKLITSNKKSAIVYLGLVVFHLLVLSCPSAKGSNYNNEVSDQEMPIAEYLKTTPKDAIIAGFPNYPAERPIEDIHLFVKRRVLFADYYNNTLHKDYSYEMNRRFDATIAMYLATDMNAVLGVRDTYGVDYVIVDLNDFLDKDPPKTNYIKKDKEIEELWKTTDKSAFIMPKLAKSAAVFSHDNLYIVDLNKIQPPLSPESKSEPNTEENIMR